MALHREHRPAALCAGRSLNNESHATQLLACPVGHNPSMMLVTRRGHSPRVHAHAAISWRGQSPHAHTACIMTPSPEKSKSHSHDFDMRKWIRISSTQLSTCYRAMWSPASGSSVVIHCRRTAMQRASCQLPAIIRTWYPVCKQIDLD